MFTPTSKAALAMSQPPPTIVAAHKPYFLPEKFSIADSPQIWNYRVGDKRYVPDGITELRNYDTTGFIYDRINDCLCSWNPNHYVPHGQALKEGVLQEEILQIQDKLVEEQKLLEGVQTLKPIIIDKFNGLWNIELGEQFIRLSDFHKHWLNFLEKNQILQRTLTEKNEIAHQFGLWYRSPEGWTNTPIPPINMDIYLGTKMATVIGCTEGAPFPPTTHRWLWSNFRWEDLVYAAEFVEHSFLFGWIN